VSQPFDRSHTAAAPGALDDELGEFWVEDPFQINWESNLSSFERNRVFINRAGSAFLEISHLTGADADADSRAVVPVDLGNDGRIDLVVRGVGGGALQVFENRFPGGNWLQVILRGQKSNRTGIGARLVAAAGGREIHRDAFPVNTYRSQAPGTVHFGLAGATQVDAVTVTWPTGESQSVTAVPANRTIVITEGVAGFETATPGRGVTP
jgi:hypothetical protein